ncbi:MULTISPECIES: hypothetical protein [Chryseobacterium]|uniref:Uncharacterized protein n=1 Tax=Chryseobacterium camelliae TaxID=1265445 RepID=A0ABU0TKW9_9FLAO|nr:MULTISPECIES: hypothetical protein [Chryseobacterium]MDT3408451.1 hypothetical protein [Pseudacidovorax intermedius]MDQ1097693.1 hypothetical protein [Chryseobacterium camelliae]MDQ1101625.1 hypothetical protein [Chryseobacterium sp. SORGH_AS_1048]MDR6085066.1 hypothetical protein [Chryseobacterium sp. SORGH_AS_0909]MDR6129421.1 hypothetical protein [Chryseobacterium sp. SORGH_AS_1175]
MRHKLLFVMFFIVSLFYGQDSLQVTNCGEQLKSFYLGMDVLHKWQSGQHIDWQTGEPDDPDAVSGIRTHCSAFVAAACERMGIYILRPPEHRQELLANAQFSWLNSKQAKNYGWHRIDTNVLYEAQRLADQGYMVVACAQNPDRHKPGHIALVMPSDRSGENLRENGPVLIQASGKNSVDKSFRDSFRHHISDWNTFSDDVRFYYNDKNFNCQR